MASYRDTLNLPVTAFPMKGDLPRREPERLRWWQERELYRKLRDARRGAPVALLHDGPPYSNNHLHMGTAANKIWKDAVVRSATLFGYDSPYVPGWDNHGMPIEIQVSKEFRERKQSPDRLELRRRCRTYAAEWVGIQREEFERLGVWGDWQRPYLTMDSRFEAEILETFRALASRGYVQRGLRSIHWCPTDRTALAEAEIEYQDDPSPSILVAFPLRNDVHGRFAGLGNVSALAWTTTPWTLPANLGLMIDPAAVYAAVAVGERVFVVAEARIAALAEMAGWKSHEVRRRFPGRELAGTIFEAPWGNDSRVVDGTPYVSLTEGTGLVHTAPGHGKEDFAVGAREGLGVVNPVDEAGRFTAGAEPFVGRSVLEVNDDVIAWLATGGRLVSATKFTHSYPHCWRCRQPVIFRATKQWFMMIDHDGHRERALAVIDEQVRWEPESSRNRIRDAVRLRPDWCLSRQRSWGVGIPALYCETCGEPDLYDEVMATAAEVTRELGSDAWYELPVERFAPAGLVCRHCGAGGPFRKETDILDVWFDSGSTHRAVRVTHPDLREPWDRALREANAKPAGKVIYFEGPDQHRGWFNSSLMVGVGIEHRAPFTDVFTHGWVLDATGRAMHKSLGNVIAPEQVITRYGADIVRWWALATDWRTDVRIGDEILQRVADAYRKVRNTFRFLLGNLHDFTPAQAVPEDRLTRVDRAFHDALLGDLDGIRRSWSDSDFHRALDRLQTLCTVDLSAVYLDVVKDRLYTLAPDDPLRRSAQTVLWRALHDLLLAASPALVFTAEEAWQEHASLRDEFESVHLASWPERLAVPAAREEWSFLIEIRNAVNARLEPHRASKTLASTAEAAVVLTTDARTAARLREYGDELAGLLIVAEISVRDRVEAGELEVEATRTSYPKCERCWMHRADVATSGDHAGLCGRCVAALAATGRAAQA